MDNKFKLIENPNEQISNIKDYIFRILSNWKWFVAAVSLALAIAYYVNISTQKRYGLNTTLLVDEKTNPLFSSGTSIAFNWGGVSDRVESIRRELISRSHNEKVVRALQFYIEYLQEGKFRYNDVYGKIPFTFKLQPNQFQLLNTLIKIEFISNGSFRLSVNFNDFDTFRLVNFKDESSKNFIDIQQNYSKIFSVDEYINLPFLKGQLLKNENANELEGQTFFIRLNSINQVTGQYQNVRASGMGGTSLIVVSMTGSNKNRIVDYLNKTVEVLSIHALEQKTNYARSTKAFIDAQFKNTSDSLKMIEDSIGRFKQQNSIYNLSAEGNEIFSQTKALDDVQRELNDRISYYDNLVNYIETHNDYSNIPAPAMINIEDGTISDMVGQLTTLSIQKEKLSKEVTANHPSLKLVSEEIQTARDVLLEKIASLKRIIISNLESSNKRLNSYNYQLTRLPSKEQKLLNFQRKFNLTESNYIFLMQKRYEADITIAATVSDITVIDSAKDVGQGSIYPRISFNYMVALLLGTIVPLFFIIAKEILDTHIHSADEIERLSPIPVLGIIGKKTTTSNLAVFLKPRSAVAESFRSLRSNIQFLFVRNPKVNCKTIVVTSSVSGEGKTFVCMNMATVFALGGKKTIIIGMDLRKPKLYLDFDISNDYGMVNYLISEASKESIIKKTHIPNLDIISSGPVPPNPAELLISPATQELLSELKKEYDYILIDTPPIGVVSDAIDLIKHADSSLYVVRQNFSQKGMLKMVNEKYEKGEVSNISIVLNEFNVKSKYGYEYGYGYGYDGYGKYARGYYDSEKKSIWKTLRKRFTKI